MSGPRLTLTDPETQATYAVEYDRHDGAHARYLWSIETDGKTIAEGDDLRAGAGDGKPLAEMLATFFGFLAAYAESRDFERRNRGMESDNAGLFPLAVGDLAEATRSDGFYMLAEELRGPGSDA